MEDNNMHTSVVIELANPKGEPEEEKSYQIDIDDLNLPKDYVIDQIFCGENVTVYALFEVPENENKNLDKKFIEVSNFNNGNDNRFYYKNSFKKAPNEEKFSGFPKNSSMMSFEDNLNFFSDKNNRDESLYCLKHPSGNYDLLPAPEKKESDLKVLYSKDFSLEKSKSTKFKAISVGVNTDIVQCPRIIEEIQKVLGVSAPLVKYKEKTFETKNSSSMPSYDVTEAETRPSLSSLASSGDSKNYTRKSFSTLFFVPLLMIEDENLNKSSRNDNIQKNIEEIQNSKNVVSKVSFGVNTDGSEFNFSTELHSKRKENISHFESSENLCCFSEIQQTDHYTKEKLKLGEKRTILKEIKIMQLKLNALIKNIESNDFELDDELIESDNKKCSKTTENFDNKEKFIKNALGPFEKKRINFDDRPIFLPWSYTLGQKISKSRSIDGIQSTDGVENYEISTNVIDSVSVSAIPDEELLVSEIDKSEQSEPKKTVSYCNLNWKHLGNSKSSGLLKSEMNLFYTIKNNGLKKSLSLDSILNVKVEVGKNFKNYFFKQEGSLKANVKVRILQTNEDYSGDNESLLKCEVREETNKKLSSKINLLNSCQENKKGEAPGFNEIGSNVRKNHNEEGDAKYVKPKKNPLTTFSKVTEKQHIARFDANVTASYGLLSPKKSLCSCRKESIPLDKTTEAEKNTCSDSEKPPTPNGNFRKIITTNSNMKKDLKTIKKANNRCKIVDLTNKTEIPSKRTLLGVGKSPRCCAESKLHIDKLLKPDSLTNHKIPQLLKCNTDEKLGVRGDRVHRQTSQKHEMRRNPAGLFNGANKETENKLLKKKSASSILVDFCAKKMCSPKTKVESLAASENAEESASHSTSQKQNHQSTNPSSIVVEVLPKKPTSMKDLYPEFSQEHDNLKNAPSEGNLTKKNGIVSQTQAHTEANENLENMEKSIVKSVWALTKVLLYEDGTKKLEVLEASLTPPGYSLNQLVKTPK